MIFMFVNREPSLVPSFLCSSCLVLTSCGKTCRHKPKHHIQQWRNVSTRYVFKNVVVQYNKQVTIAWLFCDLLLFTYFGPHGMIFRNTCVVAFLNCRLKLIIFLIFRWIFNPKQYFGNRHNLQAVSCPIQCSIAVDQSRCTGGLLRSSLPL
jgi:hypothetical protein